MKSLIHDPPMASITRNLGTTLEMIKIEHTLFALPFAFLGAVLAAKGVPTREGLAAFGEIALTGRLRPAAQTERRLEECAKLGITTVISPAETDTLPTAIAAALT